MPFSFLSPRNPLHVAYSTALLSVGCNGSHLLLPHLSVGDRHAPRTRHTRTSETNSCQTWVHHWCRCRRTSRIDRYDILTTLFQSWCS